MKISDKDFVILLEYMEPMKGEMLLHLTLQCPQLSINQIAGSPMARGGRECFKTWQRLKNVFEMVTAEVLFPGNCHETKLA